MRLRVALLAKDNQDSSVRRSAASALGRIGGEEAIHALIEALKDQVRDVRLRAADALEQFNIEVLAKGLELTISDQNSFVRRKAAEVIGYYSHGQGEEKLKLLAEDDPDPEVKQAAENAITRLELKKKYFDHITYDN